MTKALSINDEWEKYFQQNDMENEYDIENHDGNGVAYDGIENHDGVGITNDGVGIAYNGIAHDLASVDGTAKINHYNDIAKYNYNKAALSPKNTELYISTTTTISYLNIPIDINSVFWDIPIMS